MAAVTARRKGSAQQSRHRHALLLPGLRRHFPSASLHAYAAALLADWPDVEEVARRLHDHLGDGLCGADGASIYWMGCKAGLDAWRACKDAGGADGPRLQAFVDGMLDALADGLAGIEITFADGESWSPHSGAAFAEVPAGRPYTVAYRPSSTPDRGRIRSILHTLALNLNIRAILAQAGTAQAI